MSKIYYLIGKSASGKDSMLEAVLKDETLGLKKIIQYTTRPMRDNEVEGREYHFITDEKAEELNRAGKIVEMRAYDTIHGVWKYMFADDGQLNDPHTDLAAVGTVESYVKVRDYYGGDRVMPIYIYVETGERLQRALNRERTNEKPRYEELCRRFLADEKDFSDENLKKAGLMKEDGSYVCAFENRDFDECLQQIRDFVKEDRLHGN